MSNLTIPHNGTDTSVAAAYAVNESAASMRAMIFSKILHSGLRGKTCSEIEHELGYSHEASSARFWELQGGNNPDKYPPLITYLGEKRPTIRKNASRRETKARVYVALANVPAPY